MDSFPIGESSSTGMDEKFHAAVAALSSRNWARCSRTKIIVAAVLGLLSQSAVSSFVLTSHAHNPLSAPSYPTPTTRLYAEKAQVRFSNSLSTTANNGAGTSNPLDAALSWIISDVGSIVMGSIGLVALLIGRLALGGSDLPDPAETRENLLIVLAIGGVLLNGLSQLDVESATAPAVELEGVATESLPVSDEFDAVTIAWVLQAVLVLDPVFSAVVVRKGDHGWEIVGGSGILQLPQRQSWPVSSTLLLDKAVAEVEQETSLPNLQALPSKQELVNFLPSNTQAAVLVPCMDGDDALLVLGSNRARSFTPKDIAWCKAAASRL